jgi:predicted nucleic-acid-binding protein
LGPPQVYKVPKGEVVGAFRAVLASAGFIVEDVAAAEGALDAWATGRGDFADYLIRIRARALGAVAVYTFDGALHGDDGFAEP